MLVKSVESKVPTVRAYDVAEVNHWVPAQVSTSSLDRGSKLRGVIGCVKAPRRLEIDSVKRSYILLTFFTFFEIVLRIDSGFLHSCAYAPT